MHVEEGGKHRLLSPCRCAVDLHFTSALGNVINAAVVDKRALVLAAIDVVVLILRKPSTAPRAETSGPHTVPVSPPSPPPPISCPPSPHPLPSPQGVTRRVHSPPHRHVAWARPSRRLTHGENFLRTERSEAERTCGPGVFAHSSFSSSPGLPGILLWRRSPGRAVGAADRTVSAPGSRSAAVGS